MQGLGDQQIQIRLITKQKSYSVPDVPFSVPQGIDCHSLNELLNQLLKENNTDFLKSKNFEFLVVGKLLRLPLIQHLQDHGISTEATVDIEYIEKTQAPEPENSVLHDDWVCGLETSDKWILTGCYDYSVNIWTTHGKMVVSSKEHNNIIKDVSWIDKTDPSRGFVSVSHDLTGILWSFEPGTDDITPQAVLRGHERGIDTVAVSPNSNRIATGSWDSNLKIWTTSLENESFEPINKRSKGPNALMTKVPTNTLKGHKEAISSVQWINNSELSTASMDHTIKFWDVELYGIKNEIVGQKAFLSSSWSPLANTLLASSADRHIRLYDPRSTQGSLCKITFTSHTLWVSAVAWSGYSEYLFMSGGYDAAVKLWDTRSPKASLYDLRGHEGQVLSVDWTNSKYLVSGGSDNSVHIFKNNDITT